MFNGAYGSFMGNPQILKAILSSSKASILSPTERMLASRFGALVLRLFGYPLKIGQRHIRVFLGRFLDQEQLPNGSLVLDVGCSIGHDTFALAFQYGFHVIGTDIDLTSIDLANKIGHILKLADVQFQIDNILESKIQARFDLVVLLEVLEHLKEDEVALNEVNKRLKPNGLLFLAVPYSDGTSDYLKPKAAFHPARDKQESVNYAEEFVGGFHWRAGYCTERLEGLLKKTGFSVLHTRYLRLSSAILRFNSSEMLFPLVYPISRVLSHLLQSKAAIIIEARKSQ